jgi:hypothetical protein
MKGTTDMLGDEDYKNHSTGRGRLARLVGRVLCRFGKHSLREISNTGPSFLIGGASSLSYWECRRCGQVQKWFNSGEWGCFLSARWPSVADVKDHWFNPPNSFIESRATFAGDMSRAT